MMFMEIKKLRWRLEKREKGILEREGGWAIETRKGPTLCLI